MDFEIAKKVFVTHVCVAVLGIELHVILLLFRPSLESKIFGSWNLSTALRCTCQHCYCTCKFIALALYMLERWHDFLVLCWSFCMWAGEKDTGGGGFSHLLGRYLCLPGSQAVWMRYLCKLHLTFCGHFLLCIGRANSVMRPSSTSKPDVLKWYCTNFLPC